MKRSHINRRIAVAVLASAFAVVLAAPAQAGGPVRPDDRAFHGAGPVPAAAPVRPDDPADRTIAQGAEQSAVRPDDRAFRAWGPVPTAASVRPDDRADRRLPDGSGNGFAAGPTVSTPHRLNWDDTGIGVAPALAFVLLVAGVSVAWLRHRRSAAV